MRLTRTGTRRTRHGGTRRRTEHHGRRLAPCWTDKLARQLRREYRNAA